MWGDNLLLSLKSRWVRALTRKNNEISSFCRGRITGVTQDPLIPPALWVFTKLWKLLMPLAISDPYRIKGKKKRDEVIKSCAPGRCYWNLKCFSFWEEMSRGDATSYPRCKDVPGGRTVPHAMNRCWVRIVRLDEELGHFVTHGDQGNSH